MKWIQAKVIPDCHDINLAMELISDIFYDFGIQGVVVESTEPEPDTDWADGVENIPEANSVSGYFPDTDTIQDKLSVLRDRLKRLEKENSINSRLELSETDEEDWAESWKAYFWPEKVGSKIVVKPTWRDYLSKPDEIVLEIDPGMAFGTGTHATTAMCIQMIETWVKPGDSMLDVGMGSGILMIAAHKLGAGTVWGVDNDEVAVGVAEKNLLLNRINPDDFQVISGNLTEHTEGQFDLVTANILAHIILLLLNDVERVLSPNGIFICSGIVAEKKDMVADKMASLNFDVFDIREQEGWVALAGKKIGAETRP